MSELFDKVKDAVLPPKNRFLEVLGFSLESGMELKASVEVARTHIETLPDHHRVNMLEAALERGENLVAALLESGLVDIDQERVKANRDEAERMLFVEAERHQASRPFFTDVGNAAYSTNGE